MKLCLRRCVGKVHKSELYYNVAFSEAVQAHDSAFAMEQIGSAVLLNEPDTLDRLLQIKSLKLLGDIYRFTDPPCARKI